MPTANAVGGLLAKQSNYDASPLGDMMHLLRKYDAARFTSNDAMFANTSGEADIISEGNIMRDSVIICQRQTSLEKSTSYEVLFPGRSVIKGSGKTQ